MISLCTDDSGKREEVMDDIYLPVAVELGSRNLRKKRY